MGFEAPWGASPTTVRGPGFPLWLAIGMGLSADLRWLAFWGGLPGLGAAAFLTHRLARDYAAWAAMLGGIVALAHPLPSFISARVMGDDFYAALGFIGAALFLPHVPWRARARMAASVGGCIALAWQLLSRATAVLTIVSLLAGVARSRHRPMRAALLIAVALIPALLWSIRSSRLEGRVVLVHSLAAYNFWLGEGLFRYGYSWEKSRTNVMALVIEEAGLSADPRIFDYPSLTPTEVAAVERRLGRAAQRLVLEHPLPFLQRCLAGLLRFWVQAQTPSTTVVYLISVLPLLLLACVGVARKKLSPFEVTLVWSVLLHNLVYAASIPVARMSVQVFPALAYFAAIGASKLSGSSGKADAELR